MLIRTATDLDIQRCSEAGRRFYEASPYTDIPYDEESLRLCMAQMVGSGTLIIAEVDGRVVGGIGGVVSPFFLNRAYNMLVEFFWWVDPDCRGSTGVKLLLAFELAAKANKCAYVYMQGLDGPGFDRVRALYAKMGYRFTEQAFLKRL